MATKPKQRQIIYAVVRSGGGAVTVLDSFKTFQRAEEMCAVYEQQMKEKNIEMFSFKPQPSCYYDE